MPRAARGRTTRSTRSPATFALDGHLIETYNHIDDLPHLSNLPKKRPRHATRGATAAERRADRQAAASTNLEPIPNGGIVTRSSRQNLLRHSNSNSPLTAPSPSSEDPEYEHPPISCRVCLKSNTPTKIICCSICRKGIHTFCLNPPVMDLPNDASWKCIKCRRSHIPLKKEARIILRDALNTYSTLCTHNYVNAVANVVCVMSDSESDHKNSRETSIKPNPHIQPSHTGNANIPNDNTVILRVSTDDSDLDSDVDEDIQPNPIVNAEKHPPTHSPERSDTNHDPVPPKHPVPRSQISFPSSKDLAKAEPMPSSSSSLDIDDERPLSELMSRTAHKRHRLLKAMKPKDLDPAHASPKLRLKARQRSLREENFDLLSPASADPKSVRDPRNLPPKRRGRKIGSKEIHNGTCEDVEPMDTDYQNNSTNQKERRPEQVDNNAQDADGRIVRATEPNYNELKRESNEEVIEGQSGNNNHTEKAEAKDAKPDLSDASAANMGEDNPGDTEDDLPLSKRSARYRKLPIPGSSKEGNDKDTAEHDGDEESINNIVEDQIQGPNEGNRIQEPKIEAVVQETARNIIDQPIQPSGPALSTDDDPNPSTSQQSLGSYPVIERSSSRKWPQIASDPKREALFALARVQRQRPKPGDSSGRLTTSVEGEAPGRLSKVMSRTNNVPESERQRIQVTALAASSMRRNVSNMASTMAGLRPHSPRVSKGSINLLLQQTQTDVRGSIAPPRPFPELDVHEVSVSGLQSHRDKGSLPLNSSRLRLSEEDGGKFSPGMYPLSANLRRQEGPGSSSVLQYGNSTLGGGSEVYSMRQHQSIPHSGMLSSLEPEAQPFAKHGHVADLFRHAPKRQRTNKSDLHNMLLGDSMAPVNESRNIQRGDPMGKAFPEADQQILEPSAARHGTMQGHPSSRPTETGQAMSPFSYHHPLPQSRFGSSGGLGNVQGPGNTGSDRLSLPATPLRSIDDRNLRTRVSSGYSYQHFPYSSSRTVGEAGGHQRREEDDRHGDQRKQEGDSMRRGHESDFRSASQVYPPTKPASEPFSPRLRWNNERNLGTNALRRDHAGANTANQPWMESRPDHRSGLRENSYDTTLNQFIPIDRRTRRPMQYVPTATRKAQFEQGRALAIIDSRPAPPSAEPSDAYHADEGASRMTPSSYSVRQEGAYSSPSDYQYPPGGRSTTAYPSMESQPPANPFRDDYYSHRRGYMGGSNEHFVGDRSPFFSASRRDTVQREPVGGDVASAGGSIFGTPRSSVHRPSQTSSGAPLEPPIEARKGLSMERMEAPSLGPLMDSRVRSNQETDIPRMTNTLESDRRLPEHPTRLPTGPRQDDRAYGIDRMGNTSRRSQEFAEPLYGSYLSDRKQSEALHPPVGIIGARIPTPLHADPGQYRSRDTLSGQASRSFAPNIIGTADPRGVFERPSNQVSGRYNYGSRDAEPRSLVVPQRVALLEERNEEIGADRVSNIPLVARFDNSATGYVDGSASPRASDGGTIAGERSMGQRNEQREQLPSLRSNPSLRDLLS